MKITLFVILSLFIGTCSTVTTHNTSDCGNTYDFTDAYFDPNQVIYGKIRFVFMQDIISKEDSNLVVSSLELLNTHLLITNKQFLIGSIETGEVKYKYDMPYFRKFAKINNKDNFFNVYIYDNIQEDYSGDRKFIRAEAGSIPGKTVAIRKQWMNTSTISHEFGHLLGLYHIQTPDPTDGYNTTEGDLICDIRSVVDIDDYVSGTCQYIGPELPPFDSTDYTCNLLSYAYEKCRSCLTPGQIQRINFIIQNNEDLKRIFEIKTDNL